MTELPPFRTFVNHLGVQPGVFVHPNDALNYGTLKNVPISVYAYWYWNLEALNIQYSYTETVSGQTFPISRTIPVQQIKSGYDQQMEATYFSRITHPDWYFYYDEHTEQRENDNSSIDTKSNSSSPNISYDAFDEEEFLKDEGFESGAGDDLIESLTIAVALHLTRPHESQASGPKAFPKNLEGVEAYRDKFAKTPPLLSRDSIHLQDTVDLYFKFLEDRCRRLRLTTRPSDQYNRIIHTFQTTFLDYPLTITASTDFPGQVSAIINSFTIQPIFYTPPQTSKPI